MPKHPLHLCIAELVPGGTGELVMVKPAGRAAAGAGGADDDAEPDQQQPAGEGVGVSDKYSGVKVRVKFAGSGVAVSERHKALEC